MYPLLILVGQAGSGKDTAAGFLRDDFGAQPLALADPMKRLAARVFGFSEEQLWGPSECRNAPDLLIDGKLRWALKLSQHIDLGTSDALYDIISGISLKGNMTVERRFQRWLESVASEVVKRQELTPRYVLQTMGTEFGRSLHKDVWVNYAIRTAKKLLAGGTRYTRTEGLVDDEKAVSPQYVVITDGRFRNEVLSVLEMNGSTVRINCHQIDANATSRAGVQGHASEAEQKGIPSSYFTDEINNDKALGLQHLRVQVRRLMMTAAS